MELIATGIFLALLIWVLSILDRYIGMFSIPFRFLFGGAGKGRGSNQNPGLLPPFVPWVLGLFRTRKRGARFLDKRETRKLFGASQRGVLLDGYKRRLSAKDSFAGMAVISPTGAGKTTRYILPNIYALAPEGPSLVITDISGEIYQQTSGYLKRQGYTLQVLNLDNLQQGLRYNPLAHIRGYNDAAAIAHVLIKSANPRAYEKDPMWYQGAEQILTVLITTLQALKDEQMLHLPNVLRLLQQMGQEEAFEDFLMKHAPESAWNLYCQNKDGNQKMFQSFYTIAGNALGFLNDPQLAQLFIQNELDFSLLRTRKTVLFLTLPAPKISQYSVIINMAYTQLFDTLMRHLPKPHDQDVYILGDEWGHTSVPNFAVVCTNIRKYRVGISIILQSFSQLETHYGAAAKTILEGGMASKLFYAGLDTDTARRVEAILGKEELTSRSRSMDPVYRGERNLLNADGIRTLGDHDALFITTNKKPALFEDTKFCFEHPRFRKLMSSSPAPQPQIRPMTIPYMHLGQGRY